MLLGLSLIISSFVGLLILVSLAAVGLALVYLPVKKRTRKGLTGAG